jgi:tetratricopeptide (TPR) repeat protein
MEGSQSRWKHWLFLPLAAFFCSGAGVSAAELSAERVRQLASDGKSQDAVGQYEALPQDAARPVDLQLAVARAYRETGAYDKCLRLYAEILAANPGQTEAIRGQILTLFDLGKETQAVAALKNVAPPVSPPSLDRTNVQDTASAMITLNPFAIRRLAEGGDRVKALAEIERSLPVQPDTVELLVLRGEIARSIGDTALELESYARVLEKVPNHDRALKERTRLLLAMAESSPPDDALELIRRAFQSGRAAPLVAAECCGVILKLERNSTWRLDPRSLPPDLAMALARSYREMGYFDRAADCYRALVSSRPQDRMAAVGLILTAARTVENPRALLDDVDLSLLKSPDDQELKIAKAEILLRLRRAEEAMDLCREVLAGAPDHPDARSLKARLLVDKAGRVGAEGVKLVEEALQVAGNTPDIRAEYVKTLAGAGKAADAVSQFEVLPSTFCLSPDLLNAAARSYEAVERHDMAAALFGVALRMKTEGVSAKAVTVGELPALVDKDAKGQENGIK